MIRNTSSFSNSLSAVMMMDKGNGTSYAQLCKNPGIFKNLRPVYRPGSGSFNWSSLRILRLVIVFVFREAFSPKRNAHLRHRSDLWVSVFPDKGRKFSSPGRSWVSQTVLATVNSRVTSPRPESHSVGCK